MNELGCAPEALTKFRHCCRHNSESTTYRIFPGDGNLAFAQA